MANELSMNQAFIKQLDDIIEANLENEQFDVEELASALGLSRSQLHRKLNAINGKSTSQYIREYRLEKAMEMLQNNVATASEIAYRVGFGSPTYFNTSFREFYGYPPGEAKFRNPSIEKEDIVLNEKTSKQKIVWASSLGLLLLIFFSYYFYKSYKDAAITETNKTGINDKSVAVLPFKNWSGDPNLEYVSNGMTDAIISRLTKIQAITKVVPFTSMIKYKETDKTIPEIAKELGVKTILQGNFQISGDQIKVNLQLIDGLANDHFWSEEYSGKWSNNDIFKIQTEVAENVAKNMNAEISDLEHEAIQKMPTKSREAYNLYLQAEYKKSGLNETSFYEAIPLYERAIALDPNFIDAYIGFGNFWMYGGLIWGIFSEQQAWAKAKVLLQEAYELDPKNYRVAFELHIGYFYYDWNFVAVKNYLKKVNETEDFVEPEYKHYTDFSQKIGKYDEDLLWNENHIKKFPLDPWGYILNAWSFLLMDERDKCHQLISSCESMFVDDLNYLMESSRLYYYLGDYKNAKKQLEILIDSFPDRPPIIIWLNAVLANIEGNGELSKNYLGQLFQRYKNKNSGSPAWFAALYYCHIKDYEKAFEWLQKSYKRHEVEMTWLKEEPLLIPVRNDKRYKSLYKNVGFSEIE